MLAFWRGMKANYRPATGHMHDGTIMGFIQYIKGALMANSLTVFDQNFSSQKEAEFFIRSVMDLGRVRPRSQREDNSIC